MYNVTVITVCNINMFQKIVLFVLFPKDFCAIDKDCASIGQLGLVP